MSMPSGVAMNMRNASHRKLWMTAGQKNGYELMSDS